MNIVQRRLDSGRARTRSQFQRQQTVYGRNRESEIHDLKKIPSDLEQRIRTLRDSDRILSCKSKHYSKLNKTQCQLSFSEAIFHFSVRPWICGCLTSVVIAWIAIGKYKYCC